MPRTTIPVTQIVRTGTTPAAQTNADLTNGMTVAGNDGTVWLEIVSSDAGSQTVTVETPGTVDGLAISDLSLSVPAGATRLMGPFPPAIYNQPDGSLNVNTSVNGATIKLRAYRF